MVGLLGVELFLEAPTLERAFGALEMAGPAWVTAALVAQALSMDLSARMRRRLLRAAGTHVGVRDALAASYVANAVSKTFPGGIAFSAAYLYRWTRRRGAGAAVATWTLVTGAVLSAAALAGMTVFASLLAGTGTGRVSLALDAAAVAALPVVVRSLRRRPDLPVRIGRPLLRAANTVLHRRRTRGLAALERLAVELRAVHAGRSDWAAAAATAAGNWGFDAACLVACAAALDVRGPSPGLWLLAYTAGMAAASLSLLPGSLGVVDTTMVLVLAAGGVPTAAALPVVLLYRLISLVVMVTAGWVVGALQACRRRVTAQSGQG